MTKRRFALRGLSLLAGASLTLAACRAPRYVKYISPYQDFTCDVPWGWSVFLDSAGSDYTNVTFTGPLEPEFFKGVPSLSVRWHALRAPHRLPDGTYESYKSAEDFIRQTLRDVYGRDAYIKAGSDYDQQLAASRGQVLPDMDHREVSGWDAKYFVVYKTLAAPAGRVLGVVRSKEGKDVVRQRHAYVVLPMNGGFYVMVYPATREGFEKYKSSFARLVRTFKALKDGPAGAVVR